MVDYFEAMNPSIGINCTNFQPGATYCVSESECDHGTEKFASFSKELNTLSTGLGSALPISSDGLCGAQQNWTNTCIGSTWGDCCGSGG